MKSFDAIIGHKKIISHFEEAIKTGKVSHAYLLSAFATAFAIIIFPLPSSPLNK